MTWAFQEYIKNEDLLDCVSIPGDFHITSYTRKGWGKNTMLVKAEGPGGLGYVGLIYTETEVARLFVAPGGVTARLVLRHGGFKGKTTKEKINKFLADQKVGVSVWSEGNDRQGRGGTWYVGYDSRGRVWDGAVMCLPLRAVGGKWEVTG